MKIVTIVGARPQFIKAATVSRVIAAGNQGMPGRIVETLIHTGQHYDENMSQVFFDQLDIPRPDHNLGIGNASHGAMTGRMLEKIEEVLLDERPDWVLVYGDTNSTLAGALAASKLHIPVAHVEAGLRSFNMRMPEEINRILSDRVSSLLFCPTQLSLDNLEREGLTQGVHLVGDVMYDACLLYQGKAAAFSQVLEQYELDEKGYILATCHRAENTDDPIRLESILKGMAELARDTTVVFPIHPRTRKIIVERGLMGLLDRVMLLEPVSYLDMVRLESNARLIVTDSGGIQKEAFFYSVPCITLRDETEWVETLQAGANLLVGADSKKIVSGCHSFSDFEMDISPNEYYGDGNAAKKIVSLMKKGI